MGSLCEFSLRISADDFWVLLGKTQTKGTQTEVCATRFAGSAFVVSMNQFSLYPVQSNDK